MPAPGAAGGANSIVYKATAALVDRLKPGLCSISPNWITFAGLAAGLRAVHFMEPQGGWVPLVLFSILREFLDIADGVVARRCKSVSKLGGILDAAADTVYVGAASWTACSMLWPNKDALALAVYAAAAMGFGGMLMELIAESRSASRPHSESVVSRNSIIAGPVILASLKMLTIAARAHAKVQL